MVKRALNGDVENQKLTVTAYTYGKHRENWCSPLVFSAVPEYY